VDCNLLQDMRKRIWADAVRRPGRVRNSGGRESPDDYIAASTTPPAGGNSGVRRENWGQRDTPRRLTPSRMTGKDSPMTAS